MKKAALYVRVSTTHQIDKDSLPMQKKDLENYAKYVLGIEETVIFEDAGYSGKNTDRPSYQQMMERIRNGEFTHLLVWKIDRISRNLRDFTDMYDELKKYDVTFVSKNEQFDTSTAMGEAMLKIILVFAELERKLTSERVTATMLSRAENGLWNGATVPIGYYFCEETKYPAVDNKEAETVKYIYDLYEKLGSTIEVAYRLNEEKVPTKRGGQWTYKTVRDVLRNEFYIGTYIYNKYKLIDGKRIMRPKEEWIIKPNNHPSIVSKEQFDKVNQILSDNYRFKGETQRANIHTHIFGKKLYCEECGELLTAGLDRARSDGFRPSRYICTTNKKISGINRCDSYINDISIAPFVLTYISNIYRLYKRKDVKRSLTDIKRILLRGSYLMDVEEINKEALEITASSLSIKRNVELFDNGSDDDQTIDLDLERLKKELSKEERALSRLEELYLYDENSMSTKDYILKKKSITDKIDELRNKITQHLSQNGDYTDHSFLEDAAVSIFADEFLNSREIDYKELATEIGKEPIAEFINAVIKQITILNKRVHSITFKNGITHTFTYKPEPKKEIHIRQSSKYKEHIPFIINYINEHGSLTRKEVEKLTNLKRDTATALLNELIEEGKIIRRGKGCALRYYPIDVIS